MNKQGTFVASPTCTLAIVVYNTCDYITRVSVRHSTSTDKAATCLNYAVHAVAVRRAITSFITQVVSFSV